MQHWPSSSLNSFIWKNLFDSQMRIYFLLIYSTLSNAQNLWITFDIQSFLFCIQDANFVNVENIKGEGLFMLCELMRTQYSTETVFIYPFDKSKNTTSIHTSTESSINSLHILHSLHINSEKIVVSISPLVHLRLLSLLIKTGFENLAKPELKHYFSLPWLLSPYYPILSAWDKLRWLQMGVGSMLQSKVFWIAYDVGSSIDKNQLWIGSPNGVSLGHMIQSNKCKENGNVTKLALKCDLTFFFKTDILPSFMFLVKSEIGLPFQAWDESKIHYCYQFMDLNDKSFYMTSFCSCFGPIYSLFWNSNGIFSKKSQIVCLPSVNAYPAFLTYVRSGKQVCPKLNSTIWTNGIVLAHIEAILLD